ncbi:ATP-binding protein [Pedobacter sp. MC2016-15]|uniref:ATP-binding protein n=1 Tax=Pedobacter sp. MC2016-15 TaxID=2994473 RepID=UPI002245568E|nr:ATP-binding protein [Pedobacter sp. MC2016-15]MCX2480572.1 ATP-binding protein [Pedobacter sp. MC2016-15]
MITKVRKIPILRYALIVSLIVVLFISAFYLYIYYRRAENVRYNVHQMILARESASMIDNCLISLYSAENNSRLYSLTSDIKYFNQFSADIKFVDQIIIQLNLKGQPVQADSNLKHLIIEKTEKTTDYTKLKLLSDSLLGSAGKLNIIMDQAAAVPVKVPVVRKYVSTVKIDTIKSKPKPKKKFFKRLLDSFSSKKSDEESQQAQLRSRTIVRKRIATKVESTTIIPREATAARRHFQEISEANNQLKDSEKEILKINTSLINQIISHLKAYKLAEEQYIADGKTELNNSLRDVIFRFKSLSGVTFICLIAMVIVILYNIWKIFRNEEEIISYSQDAEQYAQSKSAFLASMSHEIRTPLNSVIGFSEQLGQSQLNETQREQLQAISSSSRLLLDVVNEILDFSKFETGKMSFDSAAFMPQHTLEEVFISLRPQAESKGIKIEKELDLDVDTCFTGDAFRLKQVVLNLMSNAIKFTTDGKVTLRAHVSKGQQGMKVLHVSVKDSGLGISKENIPLIFGEFAQIDSAQKQASQKGTGLGLAISKKIVELQGGSISVTSELKKGSVFSFQIPFETADLSACKKKSIPDNFLAEEILLGKHILVAEDNRLNVLLLSTILKKWKVTYDIAEDGVQALSLFASRDYDLVLTDIEMPEMGGVELARKIRNYDHIGKSLTPVLALTANALKEDRDNYMKAGMNGVILKPFSEQNLLDTITDALKDPLLETEKL